MNNPKLAQKEFSLEIFRKVNLEQNFILLKEIKTFLNWQGMFRM